MIVSNHTPLAHALSVGLGPDGQACLTVVVKATLRLPASGEPVRPHAEQWPVATADEAYEADAPGLLRLEKDTAPFKPRADVVVAGSAYAPGGRPTRSLDVRLRVGRLQKTLRVFGDREWIFPTRVVMVPLMGDPQPFVRMPITYAHAFGGIDRKAGRGCPSNFAGKGFLGEKTRDSVDGRALPNVEDPARLIGSWNDEPPPAGFGFQPPHSQPRLGYAGTAQGLQEPHPLFGLAADFRHDFFNAAHPDLQVPGYLRGDEEVELVHLTPDGARSFRLPGLQPALTVTTEAEGGGGRSAPLDAPLDTLVFLPDEDAFYQVWRGVYRLGAIRDPEALERALLRVRAVEISLGRLAGSDHARRVEAAERR